MEFNRRDFIKVTASGAAVAALGGVSAVSCTPKDPRNNLELKISFQEGTAPIPEGTPRESALKARFDFMESLGVVGYEPGGGGLRNRVGSIKEALKGRNIKISAICAGFQGWVLAEDEERREQFDTTMREIIAAAGEIGSTGVIFVPAFNGQRPSLPHTQQTRDFMCEQLRKLGDYAAQCGTTIILEPLNRGEAFYLRQVGDAASICRDINNKGVTCMGDFWHMTKEEASDYGAFMSAGKYLQHVHIASRKGRNMPGEDGEADNYIEGFKALKTLEYPYYVSFECGPKRGADREVVVPAAVKLMREQWAAAII